MKDALTLTVEQQVVQQVLVLGDLAFAFEAIDGCLVGTYAVVGDIGPQLDWLHETWKLHPHAKVVRG